MFLVYHLMGITKTPPSYMSEQNENVTPSKIEMSPPSEKPGISGILRNNENNNYDR
jgi:hypothetical protein